MTIPAFLAPLLAGHELLSFFLFLLLFGFTLPISEEVALALVGIAARASGSPFGETILVSVLALFLADLGYFALARVVGPRLLRSRPFSRLVSPDRVLDGETYVQRKGPRILFICRFVVGLRAPAIVASGLLRMTLRRFVAYDLGSLIVSTPIWIILGHALGAQFDAEVGLLGKVFAWTTPLAIVVGAILVYRYIRRDSAKVLAEAKAELEAGEGKST